MESGIRVSDVACPRVSTKHKSKRPNIVEAVIAAFNTWTFKRQQPSDPGRLMDFVRHHVEQHRPIEFVLYWGKGPRQHIGTPELACLDFLASFRDRIHSVYPPGATLRLICTDTHALLNGHQRSSMMAYFYAVGDAARQRGFRWCLLGDIVESDAAAPDRMKPAQRSEHTITQLERSAAKWFRGAGAPIDGAIAYYDMNMVEKRAIEQAFPASIFITFSGPELNDLFPERLPIFYMYSVRKGVSVKPWFIEDETTATATATAIATTGPHAAGIGLSAA